MTRIELIRILIGQAKNNGFEFRRWYISCLREPWVDAQAALSCLAQGRRYYALLFSHEFACAFWKSGETITFQLPSNTFQRRRPDGSIGTVTRRAFTRRSARHDVWRYHLQQLAVSDEPLRYMRRFLNVQEELDDLPECEPAPAQLSDPEIEDDLRDLLPD